MTAPNWQDAGPLLVEALKAQAAVDALFEKLSATKNTVDTMELMDDLKRAKAKALRLREAALARVNAPDPLDKMVDDARGRTAVPPFDLIVTQPGKPPRCGVHGCAHVYDCDAAFIISSHIAHMQSCHADMLLPKDRA